LRSHACKNQKYSSKDDLQLRRNCPNENKNENIQLFSITDEESQKAKPKYAQRSAVRSLRTPTNNPMTITPSTQTRSAGEFWRSVASASACPAAPFRAAAAPFAVAFAASATAHGRRSQKRRHVASVGAVGKEATNNGEWAGGVRSASLSRSASPSSSRQREARAENARMRERATGRVRKTEHCLF
jgi:hypothetical protein